MGFASLFGGNVTLTGGPAPVRAYSYVTPFLTDRTGLPGGGVPAGGVPLVLAAYGAAALVGTLVGGSIGDRRPYAVVAVVPLISAVTLVALGARSGRPSCCSRC